LQKSEATITKLQEEIKKEKGFFVIFCFYFCLHTCTMNSYYLCFFWYSKVLFFSLHREKQGIEQIAESSQKKGYKNGATASEIQGK